MIDQIKDIKEAIGKRESGGKYDALGTPVTSGMYKGDRAYGKYQIMGKNIPSWSKEALGTSYTSDDFLKNPDIQEKVADYKMKQLHDKYGTPEDVASAWFTGQPASKAAGKKDDNGTKATDYISQVVGFMTGAKKAEANTSETPTQTNSKISAFAAKIKSKYPQYADMSDDELTQKILAKYPQYQDMVDGSTSPTSTQGGHRPFTTTNANTTGEATKPKPTIADTIAGTKPNDSTYGKVIDNRLTRGIMDFGNALTFGGAGILGEQIGSSLATIGEKVKGMQGGQDNSKYIKQADPLTTAKGATGVVLGGLSLLSGATAVQKAGAAYKATQASKAAADLSKITGQPVEILNKLTPKELYNNIASSLSKLEPYEREQVVSQWLPKLQMAAKVAQGDAKLLEMHPVLKSVLGLLGKGTKLGVRAGIDIAGLSALKGFIK